MDASIEIVVGDPSVRSGTAYAVQIDAEPAGAFTHRGRGDRAARRRGRSRLRSRSRLRIRWLWRGLRLRRSGVDRFDRGRRLRLATVSVVWAPLGSSVSMVTKSLPTARTSPGSPCKSVIVPPTGA